MEKVVKKRCTFAIYSIWCGDVVMSLFSFFSHQNFLQLNQYRLMDEIGKVCHIMCSGTGI